MPSLRKIAFHAVPLIRRYGCPCDAQHPKDTVKRYSAVIPMRAETSFYRVTLSNSHDSTRISIMPYDVNTGDISHAIQIESFKWTPITTVTALYPVYLHDFFSFRHTSSVSAAQVSLLTGGS